MTTYVDFHILQLLPPSNINRDDTGSPKSARFGGVERHRVSSQAWKRATRQEFGRYLDESRLGIRTKQGPKIIAERICELREDCTAEDAFEAAKKIVALGGIKLDKKNPDQTGYLMFYAREEINHLAELAIQLLDGEDVKKAQVRKAIDNARAVDIALFGRMIADAPELNVDASCQVKHALSVHRATPDFDYYTAIDDELGADESGAGMIGTIEFVSSVLYRYATVSVDSLEQNLGDPAASAEAIRAFAQAFTLSMPTGKMNTFANRTRPDFVLVEIREDQPVELGSCFEDAVPADGNTMRNAALRLAQYAIDGDAQFGTAPVKSFYMALDRATTGDLEAVLAERSEKLSFPELVERIGAHVYQPEA
ncbi:type I-E CRISPR-associated protein Cas7/Cse4/CasC [Corynebacterium choanae]|uniref:CRISPR system Cascade subunit CasC n=1 Tax=Corynebacterium choanae TaxID=1862358 RepID=A0A3G6J3P4_9CORY|nr:type I-E CRISPR-associated protein Cas7/Cse4/CasC [Corynebacterium choanae]AZA12562.1 CRISPR system Cascade subunit CasC [Corynebacterium choanae]